MDEELDQEWEEELRQMQLAWEELDDFCSGEIEYHREDTIRTKDALLKNIRSAQEEYRKEAKSEKPRFPQALYPQLNDLLERFYHKVLVQNFPEPLPDWWCYSYEITAFGIELLLNRHEWTHDYGGDYNCRRWKELTLLQVPAKMLTTGEFAQMRGVEEVTVRQWIRRGKIRTAVKYGNEWRISALTRLVKDRGYYEDCAFYWEDTLPELPEKWSWLNQFHCIYLTRGQRDRKRFLVTLKKEEPYKYWKSDGLPFSEKSDPLVRKLLPKEKVDWKDRVILDNAEREALELYLIGCPEAKVTDSTILIDEFGAEEYCDESMWVDENNMRFSLSVKTTIPSES